MNGETKSKILIVFVVGFAALLCGTVASAFIHLDLPQESILEEIENETNLSINNSSNLTDTQQSSSQQSYKSSSSYSNNNYKSSSSYSDSSSSNSKKYSSDGSSSYGSENNGRSTSGGSNGETDHYQKNSASYQQDNS